MESVNFITKIVKINQKQYINKLEVIIFSIILPLVSLKLFTLFFCEQFACNVLFGVKMNHPLRKIYTFTHVSNLMLAFKRGNGIITNVAK